jgi:hypothetical protein
MTKEQLDKGNMLANKKQNFEHDLKRLTEFEEANHGKRVTLRICAEETRSNDLYIDSNYFNIDFESILNEIRLKLLAEIDKVTKELNEL